MIVKYSGCQLQIVQCVSAVNHCINAFRQETGVKHKLYQTEEIWYSQKININNLIVREFGTNIFTGSQTIYLYESSTMLTFNYAATN